jgi:class 3 adenylate cyclase/alpha-beta hydrolase superfamily lysophospholipase
VGVQAETRYARSGDVSIAYQVVGEGPFDLVFVPGAASNVELSWTNPVIASFYQRLASFSRLILFDKRGTGLSDRVEGVATLETRMDDVRAVMDAVGSERAAVVGVSEGGPMTALFAATYPKRVFAAVIYGAFVRGTWSPDFPYEPTVAEREQRIAMVKETWGSREAIVQAVERLAPSVAGDERQVDWWQHYMRQSMSPGAAIALARMNMDVDISGVLDAIQVPTLIVHREGDQACDVRAGRYLGEHIPGARYLELPGNDHAPWYGDTDAVLDPIGQFLTEAWKQEASEVEPDRVLATVLFTDIVGSTAMASELGDRAWRELMSDHNTRVRRELARYRGREIDTAGDGFFASGFDGPARAIHCACAIVQAVRDIDLDLRVGLHTGECELIDDKLGGIAVNIGARVAAYAQPGEVLVSSTVKDLVAGSGISFRDRGVAELKGVPGEWRLYAVDAA